MVESMPNIIAPRTAIPSGIPDAQMLANELPMMVPNTAPEMPSANPSAAPLAAKAIPFKKPCDIEPPKKSDVYKAKRSVATVQFIDTLYSSFRLAGDGERNCQTSLVYSGHNYNIFIVNSVLPFRYKVWPDI